MPVEINIGDGRTVTLRQDAWDGITITTDGSYRSPGWQLYVPHLEASASELADGMQARPQRQSSSWSDAEEMAQLVPLTEWVAQLCALFNMHTADAMADAQERERKEQEERERAEAERQRVHEERKERLLTEFVGEKGRIRLRGYKRWRPVTVDAVEFGQGDYRPMFYYVYDRHGWRENFDDRVRAFEVKVGSRYEMVWNDGDDDLNPWDRTAKTAKMDAAQYDGGLG